MTIGYGPIVQPAIGVACARLPFVAQMRSADGIELRLSFGAKRNTSTRDKYFAF
jgi:hypothetical protein